VIDVNVRSGSGQVGPVDRVLVIGVGNRHRGDDAVGPVVAEALAARWSESIDTAVVEGDLSALPLMWSAEQKVIIVDAAVVVDQSVAVPGTVIQFDGLSRRWPVETGISSHGFGLATAIELARRLDRLPASLTVLAVAVDGDCLDHMEPLSPPVSEAVGLLVDRVGRAAGALN